MSTTIEWTHMPGYRGETWNPITGCTKVSPACEHCYAIGQSHRNAAMHLEKYQGTTHKTKGGRVQWTGEVFTHESELDKPLRWKAPRMIFVNSMSDTFHEKVPFEFVDKLMAVAAACPQHIFLLLTKRPDRMAEYFNTHRNTLSNVWLGTTVENQEQADKRIMYLLLCPASVRFLSCEPLLGPLNLNKIVVDSEKGWWINSLKSNSKERNIPTIDWVIAGGESGHHARPMHLDWVRSLRDDCKAASVPFFFKQWGNWLPLNQANDQGGIPISHFDMLYLKPGKHASGNMLDGMQHLNWPNHVRKEVQNG